MLDSLRVLPL
ncbi:conserved membrane domain protein, partial [Chlamydia psittaci 84-8471/1]